MMAEKVRLFGDEETGRLGLLAALPGEATSSDSFDDKIWTAARYDIVRRDSLAKFGQDEARRHYHCFD